MKVAKGCLTPIAITIIIIGIIMSQADPDPVKKPDTDVRHLVTDAKPSFGSHVKYTYQNKTEYGIIIGEHPIDPQVWVITPDHDTDLTRNIHFNKVLIDE